MRYSHTHISGKVEAADHEHVGTARCDEGGQHSSRAVENIHRFVCPAAARHPRRFFCCQRTSAPRQDLGIQHQLALLHHRDMPFDGRAAPASQKGRACADGQQRPRTARRRRQLCRASRQSGQTAEQGARRAPSSTRPATRRRRARRPAIRRTSSRAPTRAITATPRRSSACRPSTPVRAA